MSRHEFTDEERARSNGGTSLAMFTVRSNNGQRLMVPGCDETDARVRAAERWRAWRVDFAGVESVKLSRDFELSEHAASIRGICR